MLSVGAANLLYYTHLCKWLEILRVSNVGLNNERRLADCELIEDNADSSELPKYFNVRGDWRCRCGMTSRSAGKGHNSCRRTLLIRWKLHAVYQYCMTNTVRLKRPLTSYIASIPIFYLFLLLIIEIKIYVLYFVITITFGTLQIYQTSN